MTLEKLEIYLWWITVLTAAITIGIIGGYYWWTRNKGSNYLRNDEIPLRYFIQKQVDRKGNTIGYECLLRTQNEAGQWVCHVILNPYHCNALLAYWRRLSNL